MKSMYHDGQRELQDAFATRRIADRLEEVNTRSEFTDSDREFIERSALFFLATADTGGKPSVSHKGGAPGFVRVIGPAELAFPDYDGNGMFVSLGNIRVNPNVGLLFIDFEKPRRLVVRGRATASDQDPLLPLTVGAQLIVRVTAEIIHPNCPRYIHKMKLVEPSEYVPEPGVPPVEPGWKSMPVFRDYVHERRTVATGEGDE